jgi:DNA polymerase-3 subunit delta'
MSFKQIYGHEKTLSILNAAICNERIAHAYLFYGIEGVGKKTVAYNFAKAINCLQNGPDACDSCASCLKIDHGNYPDLIEIDPDGQFIRIKEVREIQNQMRFAPLEGKARFFIIREADRMNGAAANALLKTLEEPSACNVLILISSKPYQLPATIVSRCQRIRFDPLPVEIVAAFLEEQCSLDRDKALILAASSAGSIGKALEMNEESYFEFQNSAINRFLGLQDPLDFFSFLSDFGSEKKDIMRILGTLTMWYRDMLYVLEGGNENNLIHRDRIDDIRKAITGLTGPIILENIKTISRTQRAIEQNANKQLALECMMFRLFTNILPRKGRR